MRAPVGSTKTLSPELPREKGRARTVTTCNCFILDRTGTPLQPKATWRWWSSSRRSSCCCRCTRDLASTFQSAGRSALAARASNVGQLIALERGRKIPEAARDRHAACRAGTRTLLEELSCRVTRLEPSAIYPPLTLRRRTRWNPARDGVNMTLRATWPPQLRLHQVAIDIVHPRGSKNKDDGRILFGPASSPGCHAENSPGRGSSPITSSCFFLLHCSNTGPSSNLAGVSNTSTGDHIHGSMISKA